VSESAAQSRPREGIQPERADRLQVKMKSGAREAGEHGDTRPRISDFSFRDTPEQFDRIPFSCQFENE
jgi:hypothetical protein